MKKFVARCGFRNETSCARIVWVEPWAADFTLIPDEEIELVACDPVELPWFSLVEHVDSTQAYVQTPDPMRTEFKVLQAGKQLAAGHNRQAAIDAGIKL